MIQTLKLIAFQTVKVLGGFSAAAGSRWRRDRLFILCYHGIALDQEHVWNPSLYITADLLRRRLETLRQGTYNILPLGEALERLYRRTLPPKSVVLTFDDGFYDFYRLARPLLREFRAPATVYVTSYYSQFGQPVFDPMLAYLLWKGTGKPLDWPEMLGDPVTLTTENRPATARRILGFVSDAGYSAREKDVLLEELASRLAVDYREICSRRILHLMNPSELRDVAAQGIDLQLHTHRHRMPQGPDLFLKEIEDNREALRLDGQSNGALRHFCYPSGVYYVESGGLLRQCGVVSATTCDRGLASPASDPYYLPRFGDSMNVPDIVFEGWASGAARFLPHR